MEEKPSEVSQSKFNLKALEAHREDALAIATEQFRAGKIGRHDYETISDQRGVRVDGARDRLEAAQKAQREERGSWLGRFTHR